MTITDLQFANQQQLNHEFFIHKDSFQCNKNNKNDDNNKQISGIIGNLIKSHCEMSSDQKTSIHFCCFQTRLYHLQGSQRHFEIGFCFHIVNGTSWPHHNCDHCEQIWFVQWRHCANVGDSAMEKGLRAKENRAKMSKNRTADNETLLLLLFNVVAAKMVIV